MAKVNANVEVGELLFVSGFAVAGALCLDQSCNDGKALEFLKEKFTEIKQWFAGDEKTEGSEANPDMESDNGILENAGNQMQKTRKNSGSNNKAASPSGQGAMREPHDDGNVAKSENVAERETGFADGQQPANEALQTNAEDHKDAEDDVKGSDVDEQEAEREPVGEEQPEQAENIQQ